MLMTNPSKKNNTKAYLEKRVKHLEDVERFIVDGLERAASLGDFQSSICKLSDVSTLLEETRIRVRGLIPFESIAFFLVEEGSNDFIMKYIDSETYRSYIQNEVDHFIDNGTFAWALREKRPIIVPTIDGKGLLLHVMATTNRIRGICIALLPQNHQHLLNTSLSLLSIILLNSANAIESFELYRTIREINSNLEGIDNYRHFFAAAPDGVEVLDASGNILDSNDFQTKFLGYSHEHLLGSHSSAYFSEDSRASFANNHLLLQEKGSWEGEVELVTVKGDIVFVWRKEKAIYDKDKKFIGAVVYNRDITARKRAEEALRQSEALLRSVFKATPIGLCIMKDRVFQSTNKAWHEIFGYSESDIIGHTPRILYESEAEYERVGQELYPRLLKHDLAFIQTKFRQKDGAVRDVALTAAPLELQDPSSGTVIAVEDITDRKRTEEELKENRRQLADIIEFLPDATLVIDKEGKVIAWNRAIEAMTGVRKEDMLGKGNNEYALPFYGNRRPIIIDLALHPDQEMEKQYTAIQRIGDTLFGEAFAPNLPHGDIHISGTASVLRDEKGRITAAIECIRDNTERQRLTERLTRAEKMEAIGTLAGGVAHDLNNVLGVLAGYSELLASKLPENSLPRQYADTIMQSSWRGAAIVQDLLTLARRGVTVSEVVDLNRLALNYLRTPEFEKLKSYHPNVKIWTELEEGLLNIKGSPVHLGKTIMNLVSNAAEAISDQGKVMLRTENRYLDQPIKGYDEMKEGDYVVLTVSDTGTGITANDLSKIFEPFYTKKVMGRSGTGLGLAVVWGTVKDHNGYIDVQSQEGKGTTFTLYFPVTREEMGKIAKSIAPDYYMSKGEFILIIDDVKEQRELAISMLGQLGYQVEAVASGEDAVEYLKVKKADLIILDMIMDPGMDGLETYRRIIEFNPEQKAVIVSGFSENDRVRKTMEIGSGAFVRKPYMLEKIGLAVRRELDKNK
jgi:two-component system, cell cycle sensor histidine kinase and response regulator CckA